MANESKPKWSDFNEILEKKRVRVKKGLWFDVIRARKKGTNQEFVRLSRYGAGWSHEFNIITPSQWGAVRKVVDEVVNNLGWEKSVSLGVNIIDQLDKYQKLNERQKQKIDFLLTRLGEFRSKKLTSDIPKFRKEIRDFKDLLKKSAGEEEVQKWLETHTWFFGPQYLEQEPKKDWPGRAEFDFLLQRYDTFYDVIELKKPNDKLFVRDSSSPSRSLAPSQELKNALAQMIEYLESLGVYAPTQLYKEGIYVLKPEGIILMGRVESEKERKTLKVLNSYLHGIRILTYDDILAQAENFVTLLEKRRD
jgi:hypothetical protein